MAKSDDLRLEIETRLRLGEKAIDLKDEYSGEVHYNTIRNWEKLIQTKEKEDKGIDILKDKTTPAVLQSMVEKAHEEAPPKIAQQMQVIANGIEGLQKLDGKFHEVMLVAIEKGEKFLREDDLKLSDWKLIVSTLADAYASVFKTSGTNINVNNSNTQINQTKVSAFKANLRP